MSRAAVPGALHTPESMQDQVWVLKTDTVCCAALADGAGSRRSSGHGAAEVTRQTCRTLCEEFDRLWQYPGEKIAQWVHGACLERLQTLDAALYELASTLLFFAAHRDGRFIAGHLGDGVQIWVQNEAIRVFSAPENGDQLNETWFVTSPDALEHLRIYKGSLSGSGTLLMMSDGTGQSLYQHSTGQPAPACRVMAGWMQDHSEDFVEKILKKNMQAVFSQRSRDDLSLILLAWNEPKENAINPVEFGTAGPLQTEQGE